MPLNPLGMGDWGQQATSLRYMGLATAKGRVVDVYEWVTRQGAHGGGQRWYAMRAHGVRQSDITRAKRSGQKWVSVKPLAYLRSNPCGTRRRYRRNPGLAGAKVMGVPLALAGLAALGFWIWKRKQAATVAGRV